MKEIGIEKLIGLLNEYDPYIASDGEHKPNLWGYAYQGHSAIFPKELAESYIVSARYGFIKWLVENDKIDKRKIDTRLVRNVESHYDEDGCWVENSYEDYSDTDTLLMLLSISSSPIEDLISYLR